MNTIVKVGIVAGLVGLWVWGKDAILGALSDFKLDIVAIGKPTLSAMVLTVPLQIRFKNPTPLPITLDQFRADIYIDKNGQFVPGATINQPLKIQPGVSLEWVVPSVNIPSIFGGNLIETAKAVQQIIANKKFRIRADITAIYKGVEIPQQSFTEDVKI